MKKHEKKDLFQIFLDSLDMEDEEDYFLYERLTSFQEEQKS